MPRQEMTQQSDERSTPACPPPGPWWRLPVLLVLVLVGLLVARTLRETSDADAGMEAGGGLATGETVSLVIDFGDGRRREFEEIAWQEGLTVRDALAAASDASGSRVAFTQVGSGAAALLSGIDGLRNEGGGGRNWTFAVSGQYGDRSFAVHRLRPGDHVLWRFADRQ